MFGKLYVKFGKVLGDMEFGSPHVIPGAASCDVVTALAEMPEFQDIVIVVEGERFKTHRMVLAAFSPVIYAIFTNRMKESRQAEVILRDLKASVWRAVMLFAYGNKVQIDDSESGFALLECARRFQMESLESSVSDCLASKIRGGNCCNLFVRADELGATALRERAMQVLVQNFLTLCRSPRWGCWTLTLLRRW